MALFTIQNLTFSYPDSPVPSLNHINLNIEKGEYVVLCGKSGSGKTTLLRHLKPVLTPYGSGTGEILFCGKPLELLPACDQASKIGFVMQNPDDQIVTDKVWHELAFGLENLGTDPRIMRLRVAEMANFFGIQDWFYRDVSLLSGGQKQLVNLAAIMTMQPDVLILDEPTSQLDPIAASDFLNTLRKINLELGTTIIITEHRLEDIYHAADRVVVMENGCITADDTPQRVGALLHAFGSEMFPALPTPVRVFYDTGAQGVCPLTVREGRKWLSHAFADRQLKYIQPDEPTKMTAAKNVALEMKDVWFRYEKNTNDILRGVSLSVPAGSLYAIVGGNGTGKSTLLKTISGACKFYAGNLTILGKSIRKYRAGELLENCVAMLPQDPKSLFVKKTVREELAEMNPDSAAMESVTSDCEIGHLLDKHPHDLSGGEQQRIALAKVLLTKPKILLLDEPTKGLDSFFKVKFSGILRKLQQQNITVIMVSHDIEFCAEYADLVSMFFDGQILTTDTPQRFFGDNSFYTTAANRMSRCVFTNAVTAKNVVDLYLRNMEGAE